MLSLSQRVKSPGRMQDDTGTGFRGGPADYEFNAVAGDRGGTGDNEGSNQGGPHSSSGFKRALMHTERTQGRVGNLASKIDTGGPGFKKPNYFAQGARRHGLHMGSGAPITTPAMDTGSDV